jgi:hypothetical protein
MTEPINTNATYATQILIDYVAYVISNDLYDDSPPDLEALKENPYINLFMNRLDALYTSDFILTDDIIRSIAIRFNTDQEEWESDQYNEYIGYEEYIWDNIMDHTPPTWAEQMAHMVRIPSGPPEIADISSVYELMLAAPTNEAAAAA